MKFFYVYIRALPYRYTFPVGAALVCKPTNAVLVNQIKKKEKPLVVSFMWDRYWNSDLETDAFSSSF